MTLLYCLQVGLATFAVYIFTKDDHRIDAQTAFVAITLFNILRFAVLVAPIMVMELVKVKTTYFIFFPFVSFFILSFFLLFSDMSN